MENCMIEKPEQEADLYPPCFCLGGCGSQWPEPCQCEPSLQERFRFYRQRNHRALAYYFARQCHVSGTGYQVPEFLLYTWVGVK